MGPGGVTAAAPPVCRRGIAGDPIAGLCASVATAVHPAIGYVVHGYDMSPLAALGSRVRGDAVECDHRSHLVDKYCMIPASSYEVRAEAQTTSSWISPVR